MKEIEKTEKFYNMTKQYLMTEVNNKQQKRKRLIKNK